MEKNKIGLIGLARRAGKVLPGYDNIERNKKKCVLLLVACDAAERTLKNIDNLGINAVKTDLTKAELGAAAGLGDAAVLALCDNNFAKMFL